MSNTKSQTASNAPELIHGGTAVTRYLSIEGKGIGFEDFTDDPIVQRWINNGSEFKTLAKVDLSFLNSILTHVRENGDPSAEMRVRKMVAYFTADNSKSKTDTGKIVS